MILKVGTCSGEKLTNGERLGVTRTVQHESDQ